MEILNYIYNKVYAPVEDDFGFDDAGDMDELDDELQVEEGNAAAGEGGDELYEHWKVQVDANQDPVRIDKYLADKMAYQSRNRIQQAADAPVGKPDLLVPFVDLPAIDENAQAIALFPMTTVPLQHQ